MKTILLLAALGQFDVYGDTSSFDVYPCVQLAEPAPPKPVTVPQEVERHATAEGGRVIVYPDPECPVVCLQACLTDLERGGIDYEVRERPAWAPAGVVLHWWNGTGWRQQVWVSLDAFQRVYRLPLNSSGPPSAGPPVQRAAARSTVRRAGLYYRRGGSTYDWPGDLRTHLTQSPHNLSWATVQSWSDGQCIAWHDSWHIRNSRRRG